MKRKKCKWRQSFLFWEYFYLSFLSSPHAVIPEGDQAKRIFDVKEHPVKDLFHQEYATNIMKEWLKVKWNPALFTIFSQDLLYRPKESKKAIVSRELWIEEVRKSQKRIRIFFILNTIAVRPGKITV